MHWRWLFDRLLVGFTILLPVVVVYLMLGQILDLMMMLTVPVMDALPGIVVPNVGERRWVAVIVLIVLFWVVGWVAEKRFGQRIGRWIERNTLDRFPPYPVIRSFARRLTGHDTPDDLDPVLYEPYAGTQTIAFIIEDIDPERVAIFVPLSPTPGVGTVLVVQKTQIRELSATLTDAAGVLLNWGAGAKKMIVGSPSARR